jgi:glutamate formiminotransferase
VCVGARGVLIAFNVWLLCDRATAQRIAACVRTASGGPPGVRALGLDMYRATSGRGSTQGGRPDPGISRERGEGLSQVSMNLIEPHVTGIDQAFGYVAEIADREGVAIEATELVGLVPEQLAPDPNGRAARLLIGPGRSLESVLQN